MKFTSIGKTLRMRHLLRHDRAVVVAVDHGNAAGVVRGLEDPLAVVKMIAESGADGILITPGLLEQCVEVVGDLAVILRIDGCATTLGTGPMEQFCSVENAIAMGVDSVVINATVGASYESIELKKVGFVSSEGRRLGIPVVAEMLSKRMMDNHLDFSGTGNDSLPSDIATDVEMAARIGVELGADAIKTRYPGEPKRFKEIVASSGQPIWVAGGPQRDSSLESSLSLVNEVMEAGASGIVFGRIVWQYPQPSQMLQALCAIVHHDATVKDAIAIGKT